VHRHAVSVERYEYPFVHGYLYMLSLLQIRLPKPKQNAHSCYNLLEILPVFRYIASILNLFVPPGLQDAQNQIFLVQCGRKRKHAPGGTHVSQP